MPFSPILPTLCSVDLWNPGSKGMEFSCRTYRSSGYGHGSLTEPTEVPSIVWKSKSY